jgi:hypothetical protein
MNLLQEVALKRSALQRKVVAGSRGAAGIVPASRWASSATRKLELLNGLNPTIVVGTKAFLPSPANPAPRSNARTLAQGNGRANPLVRPGRRNQVC